MQRRLDNEHVCVALHKRFSSLLPTNISPMIFTLYTRMNNSAWTMTYAVEIVLLVIVVLPLPIFFSPQLPHPNRSSIKD